jgi:PDZ domain-containing secreted protein
VTEAIPLRQNGYPFGHVVYNCLCTHLTNTIATICKYIQEWVNKIFPQYFSKKGVLVTNLNQLPFPLNKQSFKVGDLIYSYNDQPIANLNEIVEQYKKLKPGYIAKITFIRNGKEFRFSPTKTNKKQETPLTIKLIKEMGLELVDHLDGILIQKVHSNSVYGVGGIRQGRFITHVIINRTRMAIKTLSQFEQVLKENPKHITIRVQNGDSFNHYILCSY